MNNKIIQIKNSNPKWPSELIGHSRKKNTLNKTTIYMKSSLYIFNLGRAFPPQLLFCMYLCVSVHRQGERETICCTLLTYTKLVRNNSATTGHQNSAITTAWCNLITCITIPRLLQHLDITDWFILEVTDSNSKYMLYTKKAFRYL